MSLAEAAELGGVGAVWLVGLECLCSQLCHLRGLDYFEMTRKHEEGGETGGYFICNGNDARSQAARQSPVTILAQAMALAGARDPLSSVDLLADTTAALRLECSLLSEAARETGTVGYVGWVPKSSRQQP